MFDSCPKPARNIVGAHALQKSTAGFDEANPVKS